MKIKAILFDLDGTLRDSTPAISTAVANTIKHFGSTADWGVVLRQSQSLRAIYSAAELDVSYEEFSAHYDSEFTPEVMASIPLFNHAHEVLMAFREEGYKTGIVSSSRFAHEGLQLLDLKELFDVIVGGNDVSQHKPHPEPIFTATEALGIRAEAAVMVGDAIVDIEAGKAAGVAATIGLTHGAGTKEDLEFAGADCIIDGLVELPGILQQL